MNTHIITGIFSGLAVLLAFIYMSETDPGAGRAISSTSKRLLGHWFTFSKYVLRDSSNSIPDRIYDFETESDVLDFVTKNGDLIKNMYDHMKTSRHACVAMAQFLTPEQTTKNFVIMNRPDPRQVKKPPGYLESVYIYSTPLPNDQWSLAAFNPRITGKSGKVFEIQETSRMCRPSSVIKHRHATVSVQYWAMSGNVTESDIYLMDREFDQDISLCLQKVMEEFGLKNYCQ